MLFSVKRATFSYDISIPLCEAKHWANKMSWIIEPTAFLPFISKFVEQKKV